MFRRRLLLIGILAQTISNAQAICPYDANCINNPVGGRSPVAPQGGVQQFGIYSTNQINPSFSPNPLRDVGMSNPYAPAPKPAGDSQTLAPPLFNGLGSGMNGSDRGLQGVDPDLRK